MKTSAPTKRKSYTLKEKRRNVKDIDDLCSRIKISVAEACKRLGFHHSVYPRWKKDIAKANVIKETENEGSHYHITGAVRKVHPGKKSSLFAHTNALMRFVFELREQGKHVNTKMVRLKACVLDHEF